MCQRKNIKEYFIRAKEQEENKPFIVFLHGEPGLSHEYFIPLMNSLSKQFPANYYAYDQTTHSTNSIWSVKLLAEELNQIVEEKSKNNTVIIVAHSFGSVVAIEYAKTFNQSVDLILISWIYDMKWAGLFQFRNKDVNHAEKRIKELNENVSSPVVLLKNRMKAYSNFYFLKENIKRGEELFDKLSYYPQITEDIESTWINETNTKKNLEKISGNIISIVSQNDKVIFPDYTQEAININSKIENIIIDNSDHFSCYFKHENLSKTITPFLKKLSQETPK